MSKRNRRIILLILVSSLLLAVSFVWNGRTHQNNIAVAVAKGKAVYDMTAMTQISLNQPQMQAIALADEGLMALLGGDEFGFLDAVVLGEGEAARWQEAGCGQHNCVYISLYDYANGGTVNAVLNTTNGRIIDRWADPVARPGGSEFILPRAVAIAAADPGVQNLLGKLDQDPAMIPMSAWLADDDCREDWCVDLTYQDPAGSGKIVHVFVNMEQERVARTFMTRGRAPIAAAAAQFVHRRLQGKRIRLERLLGNDRPRWREFLRRDLQRHAHF
jgi:hypothetical protein